MSERQDMGASADAETGSREPSPSSTGLGPSGFDPARDGFPMSRLLMVAGNLSAQAAKEAAELAYGSWNPRCMARCAASEALNFFASLRGHIEFYERQAAIAMEAREGRDGATRLDGEAATARAGTASPNTGADHD